MKETWKSQSLYCWWYKPFHSHQHFRWESKSQSFFFHMNH